MIPLWLQTLLVLAGLAVSVVAVRTARTPQGAVAWVIVLVTLPSVALPAFLLFGRFGQRRYERARRASDRAAARPFAEGDEEEAEPGRLDALVRIAGRPVTTGNRVRLLPEGGPAFEEMFAAIDGAEREALVQFYIVRNDALTRRLAERLAAAARRGVSARFMFDRVGSLLLSPRLVRDLRRAGVGVGVIGGPGRLTINFRNHRKTVVVDGRLGFTGGLNLGMEYVTGGPHFEAWRDTQVAVEGPLAAQLREVFAKDWRWAAGEELAPLGAPPEAEGGVRALLVEHGPTDPIERGSLFLCGLAGLARRRLWIATPYFVPHTDLLTAVQLAALRGVHTRLLVPRHPDHLLPWYATRAFVGDLMAAGAEVWEYERGFMHQKVVLVDDDVAAIGTTNFDIRSVMLNYEAMAVFDDRGLAGEVARMLKRDFAASRRMERPPGEESWRMAVLAPVARLFAPVL